MQTLGKCSSARTVAASMLVAIILIASLAVTQERFRLGFNIFSDNRNVTVVAPTIQFHQQLTDETALTFRYGVDALSSASVSCSTCHTESQTWLRNEATIGIKRKFDSTTLGASYYLSREKDYDADALTVSLDQELATGNTTLSGRFTRSWDRAKPHGWGDLVDELGPSPSESDDDEFHNDFTFTPDQVLPIVVPNTDVNTFYVSLTQVLSTKSVAQIGYEIAKLNGYQQDPYHLLSIEGFDRFEMQPQERTRHAISGKLRQAAGETTTIGVDYRYYTDDWGIDSHTARAELFQYLSDNSVLVRVRYRYYTQTGADFYQPSYSTLQPLITLDDRLQPSHSNLLGGSVGFDLGGLTSSLSGLHMTVVYERYFGNASILGELTSGRIIRGSAPDLKANTFRIEFSPSF